AEQFGTPLHVLDIDRLRANARRAATELSVSYSGRSSVHYAMKANNTPAVVATLREEGIAVEVMTEYELWLAIQSGYSGRDIIANGPCKSAQFIRACITSDVKAIIVDSPGEIERIELEAATLDVRARVLLRINPDHTPRGMNSGSAMASRRGSPFGLDLVSGEVIAALDRCVSSPHIDFVGYHFHIGTGIRDSTEHARAFHRCTRLIRETLERGIDVRIVDIGGGFGIATSRGFTTIEMLRYEATGWLPSHSATPGTPALREYVVHVGEEIERAFRGAALPELIIEPGRWLVGGAQHLLLTIEYVKTRTGVGTWYITDGGVGTVSLPTWYEYHEVFSCDRPCAPRTDIVNIVGPGCFAGDIVYKNKPMQRMSEGETIAVMDSGAYFLALESNFGHPRSAIVGIENGSPRVLRRREQLEEMVSRDIDYVNGGTP
ncbi:MAG: hypothetical protein H7X80_01405, partial [bacterium]|nr:hypothetical protein [Candidatus Kapabacteria bacterium]